MEVKLHEDPIQLSDGSDSDDAVEQMVSVDRPFVHPDVPGETLHACQHVVA